MKIQTNYCTTSYVGLWIWVVGYNSPGVGYNLLPMVNVVVKQALGLLKCF